MKIYQIIKKSLTDQIEKECADFAREVYKEYLSGEITNERSEIIISAINQTKKRILDRL